MPSSALANSRLYALSLHDALPIFGPEPDDRLVLLGDYIDRGPDSRGVLDQLISLAGRCQVVPLLGNHEEMLLAVRSAPAALKGWLRSEEHTSELQSLRHLVCRLLLSPTPGSTLSPYTTLFRSSGRNPTIGSFCWGTTSTAARTAEESSTS